VRRWFELSLRSWTGSLRKRNGTASQGLIWGWHTGAGQKEVEGVRQWGHLRGVSSHKGNCSSSDGKEVSSGGTGEGDSGGTEAGDIACVA